MVIPTQITNLMQAIHMHPDPTLQTPFALKKNPPPFLLAKKMHPVRNFYAIRMHPTSRSLISRLASASTTHLRKEVALKLDFLHARVKNRQNIARLSRSTINLMRAFANASAQKLTLALSNNLTKVRARVATKFVPQTLLLQTLTLPSNLVHVSALKIATIKNKLPQSQIGVNLIALIFVTQHNMFQKELMPNLISIPQLASGNVKTNSHYAQALQNPTGLALLPNAAADATKR